MYRRLHRDLNFFKDRFVKHELKLQLQHGFAAFKFVTSPWRINSLLDYVVQNEGMWARSILLDNAKAIESMLSTALMSYKVRNSSLSRIMALPPLNCCVSSLYYKIHNASVPRIVTFDEHIAMASSVSGVPYRHIQSPFWLLYEMLRRNQITKGKNGRKLVLRLEESTHSDLTLLGRSLAKSRQANILRDFYQKIIADSPKPLHPDAVSFLISAHNDTSSPRVYRRAATRLSQSVFTLDEANGAIITVQ